ncbi:uncharacterized protein LOC128199913 [Bicyclus anynana]|uniref:Uncharacterized protein LOC128199913 n=1 Tax=Bicyclus anynana TaxID=110368 RepID=A0ABM3M7B3_BICAN|nr:uncharacterized protein LOC128199913 [Bicyclus anynana]
MSTLRLHLENDNFLNIISVYAPTLDKPIEIREKFYEDLTRYVQSIRSREQMIILGDFNARVGKDYTAWPKVLGRHGVGNINSNGQLLLSFCAEFDLAITNTMFRLAAKYKTTWMHPRSKHWHLIDYAIVRHRDLSQVQITRVMRSAHCWTDHRLVITKLKLCLRAPRRSCNAKSLRLDLEKLRNPGVREEYRQSLEQTFSILGSDTVGIDWTIFSSHLLDTAESIIGRKAAKNIDWFDVNDECLKAAISRHRSLLQQHTGKRQGELPANIKMSGVELRKLCRETKNRWWQDRARHIQWLSDTNQFGEFYYNVRRLIGTTPRIRVPLRTVNGDHLLKTKEEVLNRWASHFKTLLNVD